MLTQTALSEFIDKGHYRSHLRRMNKLYMDRQGEFIDLVRDYLNDYLEIHTRAAGMQLVAFYRDKEERPGISRAAKKEGINVRDLSSYFLKKCKRPGLFLGYAAVSRQHMEAGVKTLRRVLEQL